MTFNPDNYKAEADARRNKRRTPLERKLRRELIGAYVAIAILTAIFIVYLQYLST